MGFFPGNPSSMRDMNRANVLDLIRLQGPVSQAELAKTLKLQPSTILRIVKDLEFEGFICQTGQGEASPKGGRKAGLWELNPEGAFAIGVDLGADEIITILADLVGNVVHRVSRPCPLHEPSNVILDTVIETIERIFAAYRHVSNKIIGIGVALPGRVDSDHGVSLYALSFKNWKNVPVRQILQDRFGLPVHVQGDMQLMALGERWYGAGADAKHLLCIGLRRGIGLGVVINGEIYRGRLQSVGDIGHVVVEPDGDRCNCGRRGCLATVAGEPAVLNGLREYAQRNGVASFNGMIGSPEELTLSKVYEAFYAGNSLVVDRFRKSGQYIGRLLCDLVRIFDPEKIIIGGSILKASPTFMGAILSTYQEEQPVFATDPPEIVPSQLGENSIALGAAALILSQLFRTFESARPRIVPASGTRNHHDGVNAL
jgi:glucokinase-like ROK family protein